MYKMEFIRSQ